MTEKTKVLVNFIQDRSGSMQDAWKETLNGFKVFVEGLQVNGAKDNIDYLFSLTTFDTQVETPVIASEIGTVSPDELKKHAPRGGTALYDAVGATIEQTDKDRHGAAKIICVIVTDGQENSSREWTKERLNQAIDEKLKAGDWTFTYMGTQPETWDDAGAIGMAAGASVTFNTQNAKASYMTTMDAVHSLSRSASMSSHSLYSSAHADPVAMASAGMKTQQSTVGMGVPPITKARRPVPPPAPRKTKATGRWR
jgi:uncharacterized protein YegL